MSDDHTKTLILVTRDRDLSTRSYELTDRQIRRWKTIAVVAGTLLVLMAGSWLWLAAQAARVPSLRSEVRELRRDRARAAQLESSLKQMESDYAKVRAMLGPDSAALPAHGEAARPAAAADTAGDSDAEGDQAPAISSLPRRWPLTSHGYVTRGHLAALGLHPGMDIAVAAGSRILAAGGGVVAEVGEDSVYGRYVRIAHRDGYESVYGHASKLLVRARQPVSAGRVIALSGSTGVSTAPHLHFEIRKDGRAVDPATLVANPN
ncbi:MAG TPA: M23 family metallopeptidase [Longimicrobium sp.]|uniref:M23 family metallopeptidase n=1 Tax=Longimicrobium sp. TaxID=2029185 RepID=UPI002EDB8A20